MGLDVEFQLLLRLGFRFRWPFRGLDCVGQVITCPGKVGVDIIIRVRGWAQGSLLLPCPRSEGSID